MPLLAELLIQARIKVVVVVSGGTRYAYRRYVACAGSGWIVREHLLRYLRRCSIQQLRWDLVSWERCADIAAIAVRLDGIRIVDRLAVAGEVALEVSRIRNIEATGAGNGLAGIFEVAEKECLVLADGTSKGPAGLVAMAVWLFGSAGTKGLCVEH